MNLAALAFSAGDVANSPFIVPVAGCFMVLGIVASSVWSGVRKREVESAERLAAIARGVPMPPTAEELSIIHGKPSVDAVRRRANVRRGGIVLIGVAIGLMAFFTLLEIIIGQREIFSGVAVGLIPLAIGIALLIDARIQTTEMQTAVSTTTFPRATECSRGMDVAKRSEGARRTRVLRHPRGVAALLPLN